jgi:hypothetical protein
MNLNIKIIGILLSALSLISCSKKIGEAINNETNGEEDWMFILDSLSKTKPDFFYAKMDSEFDGNNSHYNFKTSLRMVKDSAMNTLITFASVPIINAIITPDSASIVNKKDKCYQKESIDLLKSVVGVDFSYSNFEEIFLGLPIDFDSVRSYNIFTDGNQLLVSNFTKKEWKKRAHLNASEMGSEMYYTYKMNPKAKILEGMHIYSPMEEADINLNLEGRTEIEGFQIPVKTVLDIKVRNIKIFVQLDYNKAEVNQPQELVFKIPEGYEKCK